MFSSKLILKAIFYRKIVENVQARHIPRWSHRTPSRIIYRQDQQVKKTEEQVTEEDPDLKLYESERKNVEKIIWKQPNSSKKPFQQEFAPLTIKKKPLRPVKPKEQSVDMLEMVIDKNGEFIYTKMSNNDARIGAILTDVKSNKETANKDRIFLEGKRLIRDALQAKCKLEYLLFSRKEDLEFVRPFLPKLGAKLYKMPYKEMQMWSDLTTNPGIMGLFKTPTETHIINNNPLPVTVLCDNVREPNNLGAILRVCSGAGCSKLLLTKGCVNVWAPKVLRTAAGAHFRMNISKVIKWEELDQSEMVILADNRGLNQDNAGLHSLPYYSVNFQEIPCDKSLLLIIGGETEGLSREAYDLASKKNGLRLNIPLDNSVESLNVGTALGIILFEIKRQLARKLVGKLHEVVQ